MKMKKTKKSDFPKWSEFTTLEKVLSIVSWVIWFGACIAYGISAFTDSFNPLIYKLLIPIVSISLFMDAYVYRKKKETMIVCIVCGVILVIMGIVLLTVFR